MVIIRMCKCAVKTKMHVKVPAVLLTLLSLTRHLVGCPSICNCNITHTVCSSRDPLLSFNLISSQIPSNVATLNLSKNGIRIIDPGAFANLSSLVQLDLSRNPLLTLHSSTFSSLSSLEFLDLSSNFLEKLPVDLFFELSNLRELILRDNRLKKVNSKQFQSLAELQHLDLSLNNLSSISPDVLDGLQGLQWLSLAANNLKTIPRAVLEPLIVLQRLLLEGNQWNCSCNLVPFRHSVEWMLYRGGYVDSIECSFPAVLQGQDLRTIPMDIFKHCSHLKSSDLRAPSSSGISSTEGLIISTDSTAACREQRVHAVTLRRAPTTLVLAWLLCGVVCLMMVVVAVYGCIYAMLMAKYKQEQLKRSPLIEVKKPEVVHEKEEEEKEMEPDSDKGAKAREHTEWMVLPPEVCV